MKARRTDTVSIAKRSKIMSAVRSNGNKATELVLIKLMREHGITGWRRRVNLIGKPDFVFIRQRVAIFVDGCFWHGCGQHGTRPRNNAEYWASKLSRNVDRDADTTRRLRQAGWSVVTVWEHEDPEVAAQRIKRVVARRLGTGQSVGAG